MMAKHLDSTPRRTRAQRAPAAPRPHRRALGLVLAALIAFALPAAEPGHSALAGDAVAAGAASPSEREYLIKAAVLYNFAKFTRWPSSAFDGPDAPLRLCILGTDPFGDTLATIEDKPVNGRRLKTERISEVNEARRCHLLFVSATAEAQVDRLLETIDGQPVLTVADMPGFARAGGILDLTTLDDRLRFDVNTTAAERAGLKLSAKLLRLAATVIEE
jgi:hypothetical protein